MNILFFNIVPTSIMMLFYTQKFLPEDQGHKAEFADYLVSLIIFYPFSWIGLAFIGQLIPFVVIPYTPKMRKKYFGENLTDYDINFVNKVSYLSELLCWMTVNVLLLFVFFSLWSKM